MLQKHFRNETHTRQYSWSTCATTSCILFNYLQLKKTRQSNPQKLLNKEEKRYTIFILLLLASCIATNDKTCQTRNTLHVTHSPIVCFGVLDTTSVIQTINPQRKKRHTQCRVIRGSFNVLFLDPTFRCVTSLICIFF